jgi:hypothetical protein
VITREPSGKRKAVEYRDKVGCEHLDFLVAKELGRYFPPTCVDCGERAVPFIEADENGEPVWKGRWRFPLYHE